MDDHQKLGDVHAVSDQTGLSVSQLNKLRCSGGGPRYIKAGHRVLYAPADVAAWLKTLKRQYTSEPRLPKSADAPQSKPKPSRVPRPVARRRGRRGA